MKFEEADARFELLSYFKIAARYLSVVSWTEHFLNSIAILNNLQPT